MKIIGVIPARMNSSRFPGKPLARIKGRPMIEHVFRRTQMCKALNEVYIATCDPEIVQATQKFGGQAILTSPRHERASDRVAEVAQKILASIYVMVQGDEPMVQPEMIDRALKPILEDPSVECVNLVAPIRTEKEFEDPNTIKVVMSKNGTALYFSREPIPTRQKSAWHELPLYKQVCIIPFRRDFLLRYTQLKPTPLEQAESIDMLRALEYGETIHLVLSSHITHAVDTPQDLAKVEEVMLEEVKW